ncbi:efflux transporter outer membrane subunit [Cupriavidus basilensis]|uniref:efflux transporter outer membrane subunit n=1 Tax=Cupriavidus basilensis TaxID=68895 RepID=UPI0039F66532
MHNTLAPMLRILGMALPLALAACTLEPTYQRPAQPVPEAWPTGPAYAAGTPAAAETSTAAADLGWQDFFVDARLRRLIELALANNRDLRVATLAIEQARAQYRIQRAAQFPAIGASAGVLSQRVPSELRAPGQPAVITQYSAGVGFNAFELDFFGRVRSLKHEALEQYLATEEARRSAHISLVAEVASAYLTWRADQVLLQISEDTLKSQQAAAEMIGRSKRAGAMAQLDLHRAETQVQTARVGVEQYTRQVAQDENAISLLIGGPLPQDLPPPEPFESTSLVAELPAGLPSALLQQRPDIMAAEHRLKASNADIGAARAAFFPTISLTGAVGSASTNLAGLFSAGMGAWTFAPQITLPIFNAGNNQARLDASKVQKDINIAAYEKTIQTAFREVADGLAARGTYDREAAAQETLVKEASETQRLSEMRFKNGVDDYFAVFDAQRQLYTAQQTLATIRLARLTSRVALYKALGGGWSEHTAAVAPAAPASTQTRAPVAPATPRPAPAVAQSADVTPAR